MLYTERMERMRQALEERRHELRLARGRLDDREAEADRDAA